MAGKSKLQELEMPGGGSAGSTRTGNGGTLPGIDGLNITDFVEKESESKREAVSIYLDGEVIRRLKTAAEGKNTTVSKMIEKTITKLTETIEANDELIKNYDKKYKRKSRK